MIRVPYSPAAAQPTREEALLFPAKPQRLLVSGQTRRKAAPSGESERSIRRSRRESPSLFRRILLPRLCPACLPAFANLLLSLGITPQYSFPFPDAAQVPTQRPHPHAHPAPAPPSNTPHSPNTTHIYPSQTQTLTLDTKHSRNRAIATRANGTDWCGRCRPPR